MKKRIKSILLNILSHLTPEIYLRYLFRKHRKANFDNIERLKQTFDQESQQQGAAEQQQFQQWAQV